MAVSKGYHNCSIVSGSGDDFVVPDAVWKGRCAVAVDLSETCDVDTSEHGLYRDTMQLGASLTILIAGRCDGKCVYRGGDNYFSIEYQGEFDECAPTTADHGGEITMLHIRCGTVARPGFGAGREVANKTAHAINGNGESGGNYGALIFELGQALEDPEFVGITNQVRNRVAGKGNGKSAKGRGADQVEAQLQPDVRRLAAAVGRATTAASRSCRSTADGIKNSGNATTTLAANGT